MVTQRKFTDSWDQSLPCSTTLVGAEGLYKESYDHFFDHQNVDFEGESTYKVNEIESLLREKRKVDLSSAFQSETDPKGTR